jgi:beta-lactamase class D
MRLNATEVFIVQDLYSNEIIEQYGDVDIRVSPCSTFKIALALMGYDAGILIDEVTPVWNYNETYHVSFENWKAPHNPKSWIAHSCVWYSFELVSKLGIDKFSNYVERFHYGNIDISNNWDRCWLSSSLKISPREQINFLQKLLNNTLPIPMHAHKMTKNILYIEELLPGWQFYGKTGTGHTENGCHIGWFVGWVVKEDNTALLVTMLILDENKQETYAGWRARDKVKEKLLAYIR